MGILLIIIYLIGVVLAFGRLAGMSYYYEKTFRKYDISTWIHKTPFHDNFIVFMSLTSWFGFIVSLNSYYCDTDDQYFLKWSYKDLNHELD